MSATLYPIIMIIIYTLYLIPAIEFFVLPNNFLPGNYGKFRCNLKSEFFWTNLSCKVFKSEYRLDIILNPSGELTII